MVNKFTYVGLKYVTYMIPLIKSQTRNVLMLITNGKTYDISKIMINSTPKDATGSWTT